MAPRFGSSDLRSGTAFGVLVFLRRHRRSPLSLRPPPKAFGVPATIYQPLLRFMEACLLL